MSTKKPYILKQACSWGLQIKIYMRPVLPSYKNQSIDLYSKSIDWFLYEGNIVT